MKFRRVALIGSILVLPLLLVSCGSDSPSQPSQPLVVATPTPQPTPTPSLGNPPVSVSARLFGYSRREGSNQGRYPIPPAPSTFQHADAIDIDCTPRDAEGRETRNHPVYVEWYATSGGEGVLVENVDYVWNEGSSWADQIEIRYLSRTGYIDVYCKIPGTSIASNVIRLPVFGGIR